MSIIEIIKKSKEYEKELFVTLLILLVAFLSFGLGRLSRIRSEREPIQIENALFVSEEN